MNFKAWWQSPNILCSTHQGSILTCVKSNFSWPCPEMWCPCKDTQAKKQIAYSNPHSTTAGGAEHLIFVAVVFIWFCRLRLSSPAIYCNQSIDHFSLEYFILLSMTNLICVKYTFLDHKSQRRHFISLVQKIHTKWVYMED